MRSTISGLMILASCATAFAADVLTTADIEKAGGLSGITKVEKSALPGAGGDLNFADSSRQLVAIVMVQPASMYTGWKERFGKDTEPLPGIGDEGFKTKPKALINYVVFKKGAQSIWIQSMGYKGTQQTFSAAQLTELAKIAAGRI
jgi:hypothetical protein